MIMRWREAEFSIVMSDDAPTKSWMVDGMTEASGAFGIHFADSRCICVTHLITGKRAHPEPGFRSIGAAMRYAEAIYHFSDHWGSDRPLDTEGAAKCHMAYVECYSARDRRK